MNLIPRPDYLERIETGLSRSVIVALLGPRQCGKSTLALQIAADRNGHYYDLENPDHLGRLKSPLRELQRKWLIMLDEIQRRPDLLPTLREIVARRPGPASFLHHRHA